MTGTIGPKRYRILFFGAFAPHMARVDAAAALKQLLDVPDEQLGACFSGRKVALRQGLNEDDARRWRQRLTGAGLDVTVDPPLPAVATTASGHLADASTDPDQALVQPATATDPAPMARAQPRRHARLYLGALAVLALAAMAAVGWRQLLAPRMAAWQTDAALSSAMAALEVQERAINDFVGRTGFLPNHPLDMGINDDSLHHGDSLDAIRLGQSGQLTLVFSDNAAGLAQMTLIMAPARRDDGTGFQWHCAGGSVPVDQWPARCQQQRQPAAPDSPGPRLSDLPELAGIDRPALSTPSLPALDAADPVQRILAQIIEDTLDMRLKALRHYMESLSWPQSNDAVGLPAGNQLAGKHMRHLKFVDGGRIEVRFDDSLPALAGHRFWLKPTMPGQWACESTLADDQLPLTCNTPIK